MQTPDDEETTTKENNVRLRETVALGTPFCSECGYDLTGCTDSARCPECGRPLVETLTRPELQLRGGKRYRSKARIMGMPAIDIALGPSENESVGRARGFLAIGDKAFGVVAIGGSARGIFALGGMSTGIVSVGGMSAGLFSTGGLSLGLLASSGGMSIGGLASGGMAVGGVAQGGMAVGLAARGGGVMSRLGSSESAKFFDTFGFYFGGANPTAGGFVMAMFLIVALWFVGAAACAFMAWMASNTQPGSEFGVSASSRFREPQ